MKQKVDSPKPLDEAAEMQVLKMLVKQRTEAAEMFRKAGRAEQAEKEEAERELIESYLPAGARARRTSTRPSRKPWPKPARPPQADGRGDEGRAGQAGREDRGWQSAER